MKKINVYRNCKENLTIQQTSQFYYNRVDHHEVSDAQYERYCERNFTRRPLTSLYIITFLLYSFKTLFFIILCCCCCPKKYDSLPIVSLVFFSFIPRRACISCLLFVCWLWWQSQGERELKITDLLNYSHATILYILYTLLYSPRRRVIFHCILRDFFPSCPFMDISS